MKRAPRIDDLTDDALACFVLWCRLNDEALVTSPEVARRVLHAYASTAEALR